MVVWLEFLICLVAIAFAGHRLCLYGDVIGEKLALSRSWVGVMLVASVTSLPELATGISSVSAARAPDIAVGNVLGACTINLLLIVLVDLLHRDASVYARAHVGHTLSAGFGVILLGFVGINLLLAKTGMAGSIMHIGWYSPIILLIYVLAMRAVFHYEQLQQSPMADVAPHYRQITLRQAVIAYLLAGAVVVAAGIALPFVGKDIAGAMGWEEGFVGTLFVAVVTTLPEAAVTIAALRLGALDMALGNLFGSNLFNLAILAVDDLFYLPGPLLADVTPAHAVTAFSAMMMCGIAIVGLFYRPRHRLYDTVGWTSLFLVAVFVLNTLALYLYGQRLQP